MKRAEIKFGLVRVNSWSNKRDILVSDTYVGLRISDDRCGGVHSCGSCKRRVQGIVCTLKNLKTTFWWQKYENGHWIILEKSVEQDSIEFLNRNLWVSLKELEWLESDYGPIPDPTKACCLPA